MVPLKKRIGGYLAKDWIRQNFAAVLTALFIISSITIFFANSDVSSTVETVTVKFAFNNPDKYSSTDSYVIAQMSDGKTIYVYLPPSWVPPKAGSQVSVRRIKRLFFGERFVLLQQL
jgi:hypothetical protein